MKCSRRPASRKTANSAVGPVRVVGNNIVSKREVSDGFNSGDGTVVGKAGWRSIYYGVVIDVHAVHLLHGQETSRVLNEVVASKGVMVA